MRAASSHLAGLSPTLDFRLHVPQGAARFFPDPGLEARQWPFPEGVRLGGASRLAAPIMLWRKLRAFERLCRRIAEAMSDEGCERALVHPSMIVAAPPLIGFLGIPSVYYCHEFPRHFYEKGVTKTPNRLSELVVRHVLSREKRLDRGGFLAASEVVTNSSYMAPRLEKAYGRRPAIVRPAVDASVFTPRYGGGSGYALSVGALHPLKGHDLTVRAISLIPRPSRPPLVIVGDRGSRGYADTIERMAVRLGVDLAIRVSVPFEELQRLYSSASVVVCTQKNEPYGFVPLEAMASGRPVVAVAEGGFVENVADGETGVLVPRDAGALAAAVSSLLSDHTRCDALGRAGRAFVERERNPATEAEQMLDIILRVRTAGG
ncbi:glycosyltransferase family 4 protein [Candidatus Fermentibacteria bacterium]|nr:glycosyltransferase family 4 protein [Candidatus Fermentibacteria bacterium]